MQTVNLESDLAGACILGLNHITPQLVAIGNMLEPSDFENQEAANIFFSTKKVLEKGESLELLTIAREAKMTENELLEYVIAMPLANRSNLRYSELRMKATAQRLLELSVHRKKKELDDHAEITGQYGDVVAAKRRLDERLKLTTEATWQSVTEAGRDFFQWLTNRDPIKTISTPWPSLNHKLAGGLRAGQMIVIAGRPGTGKTVAAVNMAINAARHGHSVFFVSLEMTTQELMARSVASLAGVNLTDILMKSENAFSNSDFSQKITTAGFQLRELGKNLLITENKKLNPSALSMSIEQLEAKPEVIVVDYLQLMMAEGKTDRREEEVAKISRGLKLLAMELKCAVIVLAQLNREVAKRQEKRPVLTDLRESGAIEQDADTVIMLYSEGSDEEISPQVEFLIRKQRGGALGTVFTTFQKPFQRFIEETNNY